ncbi:uncharacterized protein SPPG_06193 [Spizellomyces punctatus DAOM BR117]|uniref:Kinesin motor domain-containing protein n=1 Tax=Spizellomyces punctatus (strain DAOM BR117) TaxID=645134 RepID=A0A0L0HC31_SPIPD|nr:uncharacterized protein SPPG_06193 [Spizellomyces punctatus DAOM BR117]KNC98496.1 hypothetical protein SPPG_06193 [Spizellomyces punctatus DAOM BR117]|eukprot:XP_016606536.1 hypothetical protein SPPG_06193 [Spizellomyces punctatus DAOM BR117]
MSSRDPQEANIAVVVRVRPRNQKEIRENSPITVTTNGIRGRELHVKANQAEAATKTYSFDKVFGPDAGQDLLFDDVVAPMLKEVLMGYNCTIFAYGQTGTGKTYTMEGDLATIRGEHAGIIPRTLYSLFNTLESGDAGEYSVRVSFIELYNEELKDLLSSEEDFRKLRIFEDYNKKGSVVIQGVEETLVKNAADVIAVLQRGSNKRQIAATKMNEVSSRSHCIFCITVHIKETTPEGEELVKVGKLNLVDLAGSENIGRSGAENRRAKEAGMINQSLLTLGRVINALVDRSPHIPYRESKLTRLLQDSLGGRTKTCIIAAVSPAKCNIEETMSTLDYAHRAKNIRNKPEVNQRMTKRALLRDYEDQIQRLKADLTATQAKNGIYLSHENYTAMMADNQSNKERVEELSKMISGKEQDYKHLNLQLQQNLALLSKTTTERDSTMAELDVKRKELEDRFNELRAIQQSLLEQKLLTGAHADTEKRLDKLAAGLVSTLKSSISDVEGLHQKLERKSAVENENMRLFQDFQNGLLTQMAELDDRLGRLNEEAITFCQNISSEIGDYSERQRKRMSSQKDDLHAYLEGILSKSETMTSGLSELDSTLAQQLGEISELTRSLKLAILERERKSREVHSDLFNSHKDLVIQHQKQVGEWNASMKKKMSQVMDVVKAHIETEAAYSMRMQQSVEESMQKEIATLRLQNQKLQEQLADERRKAATAADGLLSNIANLVSRYKSEREECLLAVEESSTQAMKNHVQALDSFIEGTKTACAAGGASRDGFMDQLANDITDFEQEAVSEAESLDVTVRGFLEQCSIIESSVEDTLSSTTAAVVDSMEKLESAHQAVHTIAEEQQAKQTQLVDELQADTKDAFNTMQEWMGGSGDQLAEYVDTWEEKRNEHLRATEELRCAIGEKVQQARSEIVCNRLAEDEPTGQTPRKRTFRYATSWHITRNHDDILREYRENGRMVSPTTTSRSYEDALEADGTNATNNRADDALWEDRQYPWDKENGESGLIEAKDRADMNVFGTPRAGSKLPRTKSRLGNRKSTMESPLKGMENIQQ